MKRQCFRKLLCMVSLVMMLGLMQVPAYAEGAAMLWAIPSDFNPEAGETITVTVSMISNFEASSSDTQLLIGLSSSNANVLAVKDVKPMVTPAEGEGLTPYISDSKSNAWMIYENESGLSSFKSGSVLEVTLQVNPDLAAGGNVILMPYYAIGSEANPVIVTNGQEQELNETAQYFSQVSISCVATATGKGCYVFLNTNGGTLSIDTLQTSSDGKLSALPTPTREGYTFDGWYTAMSGGEKVTAETVFSDNANIYAHWTVDTTQEENSDDGGNTMGDAVTLGVAGSIISVFVYLLILLLV